MLTLVLPTPEYKEQVLDYKREFLQNGDILHGTAGLSDAASFEEWCQACQNNQKEATVQPGLVPATLWLAVSESGQVVGMIHLRHRLNDFLFQYGGHIGYSIRKSQRRKGYATEMLKLALQEAHGIGLDKVLVTCRKTNIGSAKTILNNGGILENEVIQGDHVMQRYWIAL